MDLRWFSKRSPILLENPEIAVFLFRDVLVTIGGFGGFLAAKDRSADFYPVGMA